MPCVSIAYCHLSLNLIVGAVWVPQTNPMHNEAVTRLLLSSPFDPPRSCATPALSPRRTAASAITPPPPPLPRTYPNPPDPLGPPGGESCTLCGLSSTFPRTPPAPLPPQGELRELGAALQRDIFTESPCVRWGDISGLDTAKRLLGEAVVAPMRYPELFTGGLRRGWGALCRGNDRKGSGLGQGGADGGRSHVSGPHVGVGGAPCMLSYSYDPLVPLPRVHTHPSQLLCVKAACGCTSQQLQALQLQGALPTPGL